MYLHCFSSSHFDGQLFSEAEQAFMQVLKLDKNCEDAMKELLRVRTHQLTVSGQWDRFRKILLKS